MVGDVEGIAPRGTLVHVEPGSALEARYGGPGNLRTPTAGELAAIQAGHYATGASMAGRPGHPAPPVQPRAVNVGWPDRVTAAGRHARTADQQRYSTGSGQPQEVTR
ncbi:MAG TPA: hypothetical protein VME19_17745 [Streptosporangiaceae bacterium]|nr:hypothetical protein [Streptosporangiaceae bacterium]